MYFIDFAVFIFFTFEKLSYFFSSKANAGVVAEVVTAVVLRRALH